MVTHARLPPITSVHDLRRLGSFTKAKAAVQATLPGVKVRARGWDGLWDVVQQHSAPRLRDGYFVSPAAETIFYLLEFPPCDARSQKLGIGAQLYADAAAAKAWRDNLAKVVHPDKCDHERAPRAMAEVNEIYGRMLAAHRR